jgi:hypothetical protein
MSEQESRNLLISHRGLERVERCESNEDRDTLWSALQVILDNSDRG